MVPIEDVASAKTGIIICCQLVNPLAGNQPKVDVNNIINFTEWPDEDVYLVTDLELIQKIKDSGRHWEPVLGENEELINIIPDDDFK